MKLILTDPKMIHDFQLARKNEIKYDIICFVTFFSFGLLSFSLCTDFGFVSSLFSAIFLQILFLLIYDKAILGTKFHPKKTSEILTTLLSASNFQHFNYNVFVLKETKWVASYPEFNPQTQTWEVSLRLYNPDFDDCDP